VYLYTANVADPDPHGIYIILGTLIRIILGTLIRIILGTRIRIRIK
jgi:hypothetical protein